MLCRIKHLTNFGNYRQFQWGVTAAFSKRNLIYGWNYSGKTTLSRLFQILAEPNQLAEWPGCQFEIELQDGSLITHTNLTTSLRVSVFNRDFIQRNFQQEYKAPAVFIIGGDTIHLRNQIARLNEHENSIQRINDRFTENHQRLRGELDLLGTNHARTVAILTGDRTYNRTKLLADNDRVKASPYSFILTEVELDAKVSLLRSNEQWPVINLVRASRANINALHMSLLSVIQKTASNEAIVKLRENRALESWIRKGLEQHLTSSQCEFCGSIIPDERLVSLQRHFSRAYEDLASEVASHVTILEEVDLTTVLPNERDFLPDLRLQFNSLKNRIEEWITSASRAVEELTVIAKQKQVGLESILECDIDTSRSSEASQLVVEINSVIALHNQKRSQIDTEKIAAKDLIEKHHAASFCLNNDILNREREIQVALDGMRKAEISLNRLSGRRALLEMQIQQQSIAAQKINETVRFLLPDNNISVTEVDGGSFEFRREGSVVSNLSDGEKTAITFAYFLATLENNGASLAQRIVFIDDPISSLDSNHVYAIYALISRQLETCLQIFVSTHNSELYTLLKDCWFHARHQYANTSDACAYYIRRFMDTNGQRWHSELNDSPALLRKYKSEYQFVFEQLHIFSSSSASTLHEAYTSPNLLRKLLEAYLGFKKPCVSKWSNKLDLLFDLELDRVEIQKFADDASHLQGVNRALQEPSFVSSSQNTVRKVIQAFKTKDPLHYTSMCTAVGVAP
jgi:wobble nucleotide-excising tRNase